MLRLQNERKAIEILSKTDLVSSLLYTGNYKSTPFIILKNIVGSIGELEGQDYLTLIPAFYKEKSYELRVHPRVISLHKKLQEANLLGLAGSLSKLTETSTLKYKEVYEHGDFAPWNIIQTSEGLVPFDFEYSEEVGLEYLDELKYHFQIEHLLNAKNGNTLIESIAAKVNIPDFKTLIQIFLIKEILMKNKVNESVDFENSLLHIIANKS